MDISKSIPAVTGAGRGLGRDLVDALLGRGVEKVYALARDPGTVHSDPRVVPLRFDLLDPAAIEAAARSAADTTLLINNAGVAHFGHALDADLDSMRGEMAANYEGLLRTLRAFVPVIEGNGGGEIVNVLSQLGLSSKPVMAGYAASKAAAHSLTQALRPVLAVRSITIHGAYPAGIDTEMLAGVDIPKTPPADVAEGILAGLEAGEEDIYPDPNGAEMAKVWRADPKAHERILSGVE